RVDADGATPAGTTADGDARDAPDHVLEAGDVDLRPGGLVGQRGQVERTSQDLDGFGGIEAEIFRVTVQRDIAPRFEETWHRNALLEMLAVVPAVEFGLMGGVDVHRRQQHAFPASGISKILMW